MNLLLIGSGGREHAFAYKISESRHCTQLFIMPGNPGTASLGKNVSINPNDFESVGKFSIENNIELLVVGPEEPLVKGLRNYFMADDSLKKIKFIGPGKDGAMLEGSKDWSKAFMKKYHIPTAAYETFTHENLN